VRHGKSFTLGAFVAYGFARHPDKNFLYVTYSAALSEKFSRRIRILIQMAGVQLAPDYNRLSEFQSTSGGSVVAASMTSNLTGRGADVIVLDDPLSGREAADSLRQRETCFDVLTDDLYSRLEPGASMILTAARWHEDDPTGRILDGQIPGSDFVEYRTPALRTLPDGTEVACWPERWSVEALQRIREECGGPESRKFLSLYQGSPRCDDGAVFRGVSWCDTLPSFD
jgi:hypothetical protein